MCQGSRWKTLAGSVGDGGGCGEEWPHLSGIRRPCLGALEMEWLLGWDFILWSWSLSWGHQAHGIGVGGWD